MPSTRMRVLAFELRSSGLARKYLNPLSHLIGSGFILVFVCFEMCPRDLLASGKSHMMLSYLDANQGMDLGMNSEPQIHPFPSKSQYKSPSGDYSQSDLL